MTEDTVKITVRPAIPSDMDFILATWLRGQKYGNPFYFAQPKGPYFKKQADYILTLLATPDVSVMVASDENAPEWVVGYAVYNSPMLHWVHIKESFRNKGVATLLLKDAKIEVAKGLTKVGWFILQKKGWIYDPKR